MEVSSFIDYYEILEVSSVAKFEAIERKFRYLARRYHPDNQATGDRSRFDLLLEAHDTLKDSAKRARYDRDYPHHLSSRPNPDEDANDGENPGDGEHVGDGGEARQGDTARTGVGIERDVDVQNRILTTLYVKRRTSTREPGVGDHELEQVAGCPVEHLDFHIWYLKEKGWIIRGDDGLIAITIDGVDRAALVHQGESAKKLLTDQS